MSYLIKGERKKKKRKNAHHPFLTGARVSKKGLDGQGPTTRGGERQVLRSFLCWIFFARERKKKKKERDKERYPPAGIAEKKDELKRKKRQQKKGVGLSLDHWGARKRKREREPVAERFVRGKDPVTGLSRAHV